MLNVTVSLAAAQAAFASAQQRLGATEAELQAARGAQVRSFAVSTGQNVLLHHPTPPVLKAVLESTLAAERAAAVSVAAAAADRERNLTAGEGG